MKKQKKKTTQLSWRMSPQFKRCLNAISDNKPVGYVESKLLPELEQVKISRNGLKVKATYKDKLLELRTAKSREHVLELVELMRNKWEVYENEN